MNNQADFSLQEFLAFAYEDAVLECPLYGKVHIQDYDNFLTAYNLNSDSATEILEDLGLISNGKFIFSKKYFNDGFFEKVFVKEIVCEQEVFRTKVFMTDRGAYFLNSILIEYGCEPAYEPSC